MSRGNLALFAGFVVRPAHKGFARACVVMTGPEAVLNAKRSSTVAAVRSSSAMLAGRDFSFDCMITPAMVTLRPASSGAAIVLSVSTAAGARTETLLSKMEFVTKMLPFAPP